MIWNILEKSVARRGPGPGKRERNDIKYFQILLCTKDMYCH